MVEQADEKGFERMHFTGAHTPLIKTIKYELAFGVWEEAKLERQCVV